MLGHIKLSREHWPPTEATTPVLPTPTAIPVPLTATPTPVPPTPTREPPTAVRGLHRPDRSALKAPSQYFSNLFNAYTKAFNRACGRSGSLFQRPFGRVPVTSNAYLSHLVLYMHHNPQKHGLVDDFRDWPYSSYQAHLSQKATRLDRDEVLAWFDGVEGFKMAHRQEPDLRLLDPLIPEDFD